MTQSPPIPTPTSTEARAAAVAAVRDALIDRQRFVISSHARPDGDAIGSQMAMALALEALGKEVVIVNADPVPGPLQTLPGVDRIRVATTVGDTFDAAIIMECGSLERTGVAGLDQSFIVNIDHHEGNSGYGNVNWFDGTAAACAEMVFAVVEALGVTLTPALATHIYVGILTDTGSFRFSGISARTFDICRQLVEAGVNPARVARAVFDSNTLGRLKLFGAVLNTLELAEQGRIAILRIDEAMARAAGATYEDTEGLINLPLTVGAIRSSVFFKEISAREHRVSLRSKGAIDVAAVARGFGGGGHRNAAGCTVRGDYATARAAVLEPLARAVAEGVTGEPDLPLDS
jgi:bifunctional oligoribonuclease and PAP phosphatase NrnA